MRYLLAAVLALFGSTASATTYDYVGQPFTSFSGLCNATICTSVSGFVTFNFDTSHFSGTLFLSDGDTARLSGPGAFGDFPSYTNWHNPPTNTYGFTSTLSGNFTLVDGSITSWALTGGTNTVGCGGGPGCLIGNSSVSSNPTSDNSSAIGYTSELTFFSASNSGGGIWIEEQVAAVPEPSTWAMLLIGFAGIGVASYRRSRRLSAKPQCPLQPPSRLSK
jgi:PEP-CTERM motif